MGARITDKNATITPRITRRRSGRGRLRVTGRGAVEGRRTGRAAGRRVVRDEPPGRVLLAMVSRVSSVPSGLGPEAWEAFARKTAWFSLTSLAALRPGLGATLVTLVIYAALLLLHPLVIGVSPLP